MRVQLTFRLFDRIDLCPSNPQQSMLGQSPEQLIRLKTLSILYVNIRLYTTKL